MIVVSICSGKSNEKLCDKEHRRRSDEMAATIFNACHVVWLYHQLSATTPDRLCLGSGNVSGRPGSIADAGKVLWTVMKDHLGVQTVPDLTAGWRHIYTNVPWGAWSTTLHIVWVPGLGSVAIGELGVLVFLCRYMTSHLRLYFLIRMHYESISIFLSLQKKHIFDQNTFCKFS